MPVSTNKVPAPTTASPLEPLLTIDDLGRLLRVSRRTIDRLCKRGELPPPRKIGGGKRWRRREIEPLL
jgi:excisionase family DNA binding protein